jgi:hypothetical protein
VPRPLLERRGSRCTSQSLAAFFGQTRHKVTKSRTPRTASTAFEDRVHGGTHEIAPRCPSYLEVLPASGTRRERLAAWVTDPRNVYFARATGEPGVGDGVRPPAAPPARSANARTR